MLPLLTFLLTANVAEEAAATSAEASAPAATADAIIPIPDPATASSTTLPVVDKFTQTGDSIAPAKQIFSKESWSAIKDLVSEDTINHVISTLISFGIRLAIGVGIFILGKFLIKWIFNWLKRTMTKRGADASLITFLLSLVKITLYFILVITVIGILGVPTSSFLAVFASAGVAIGLALSGTLQNFAGGVLILFLRPYKVGDFIEAQGFIGRVKEIQIFNTIINTPDNKTIVIPNGGLSTGTINNYSMEKLRRVDWTVGVAYGSEFEHVRKVMMSILEADERVLKDPKPLVAINELADSSVNIAVRGWVESQNYWDVFFDINEAIYKRLPEEGISFPFPQMDVHLQQNS